MSALSDLLAHLGGALAVVVGIYMAAEHVRAARTGRFSYWRRRANGAVWPPVRSENPIKFWIVWSLVAGPFLLFSLLAVVVVMFGLIGA